MTDSESGGLFTTYKNELESWGPVNRLLKQHGLQPVIITEPSQMLHSNDVVGFSKTDSESLRVNLTALIKDGDRRQTLIQDLILTNNQLRNDLETRGPSNSEQEELQQRLNSADSRIQELEYRLEQQKLSSLEHSEKDQNTKVAAQARARQLEKRSELQEEELERLRLKLSHMVAEQDRREARVQEIFTELRGRSRGNRTADERLIDVIDTYENELAIVKRKLLAKEGGGLSGDDESYITSTTERFKGLVQKLTRDSKHTEKELKRAREQIDILELELQARPQTAEFNKSKQKIRQLERLLQEHSIGVYGKDAFNKKTYSTKREDIEFLPLLHCRKYLQEVCDRLELSDLDELADCLDSQITAVEGFPKLQGLVLQVVDIVDPTLARDKKTKHKVWCTRHWKNILAKLEIWSLQNKQISELRHAVSRLLQQFDKPRDALGKESSLVEITEAIISITSDLPPVDSQPVLDEKTSPRVLLSMVKHFQHLFDVPSVSGVYPRMNEIYTRYNEHRNVQKTLAQLLDLGKNFKGSDIVDAVGRLCQTYTTSTYKQLKQLLQEDDLDSVIERLDEHRRFLPLFRDIMDNLMELLDVERLDQIVPSVRALKLMIS